MLDKYRDLEGLAGKLGVRDFSMKEAGGKVQIAGKTTYALERDLLWDAIKKHAGWEGRSGGRREGRAHRHPRHPHRASPASRCRRSPRSHLDDANRYMDIFNANKDKLKDPNMIHPGQELVIPNR